MLLLVPNGELISRSSDNPRCWADSSSLSRTFKGLAAAGGLALTSSSTSFEQGTTIALRQISVAIGIVMGQFERKQGDENTDHADLPPLSPLPLLRFIRCFASYLLFQSSKEEYLLLLLNLYIGIS